MAGEEDLETLIASMSPVLKGEEYVFCTVPDGKYGDYQSVHPIACFQEPEGLTLIVEKHRAEQQGLEFSGVFSCLTLLVHSSLQAVGLTAAVSTAFARRGISANVVAGHFHDHVFVPHKKAKQAIDILKAMSAP